MKHDVSLYFKVLGAAQDKDGNPAYAGMKITIGSTDKNIPYSEIVKKTTDNVKRLILNPIPFDGIKPKDMIVITPEEYEREYGT